MDGKHINIVRCAQINFGNSGEGEKNKKKSIFIAIYYDVVDDGMRGTLNNGIQLLLCVDVSLRTRLLDYNSLLLRAPLQRAMLMN